jgi:integrase
MSGLRIGEAIRLRMDDVDLANAVLTIRDTKFGKSRLVPLHPTTVNELRSYKQRRDALVASQPAAFFFISRKGTRLIHTSIYRVFNGLSVKVGIRKARGGEDRGCMIFVIDSRLARLSIGTAHEQMLSTSFQPWRPSSVMFL